MHVVVTRADAAKLQPRVSLPKSRICPVMRGAQNPTVAAKAAVQFPAGSGITPPHGSRMVGRISSNNISYRYIRNVEGWPMSPLPTSDHACLRKTYNGGRMLAPLATHDHPAEGVNPTTSSTDDRGMPVCHNPSKLRLMYCKRGAASKRPIEANRTVGTYFFVTESYRR
jgi:hypothetical protein